MQQKRPAPADLWHDLNLLDDYLGSGFARLHPELSVEAPAVPADAAPPAVPPAPGAAAAAAGAPAASGAAAAGANSAAVLSGIAEEVSACTRCALSMGRSKAVPGEGSPAPQVLVVGEGPGEEEDRTGRPFVGRAGQYLDTWLKPLGLDRTNCFIANAVKCRPPQNREPRPEEIAACAPFLDRQIQALKPKAILCLGRIAAHRLLDTEASLARLRGRVHACGGIPLVVTYHPSAVLRDQTLKRPVWEDLKLLKTLL
jgi:DNA polymerase